VRRGYALVAQGRSTEAAEVAKGLFAVAYKGGTASGCTCACCCCPPHQRLAPGSPVPALPYALSADGVRSVPAL